MSITRALNVKERIQLFCDQYEPPPGQKSLSDDRLEPRHWEELEYLHNHLETFYEGTLMAEGRHSTLADHFQTLDWMMDEIQKAKQTFEELYDQQLQRRRHANKNNKDGADDYHWLTIAAECAWQKCEQYYNKADESPAYYAGIILNPTLKTQWFRDYWSPSDDKRAWIEPALDSVKEFWLEEYKGKFSQVQQFIISRGLKSAYNSTNRVRLLFLSLEFP
jgi:hypothetical protein